MESKVRNTAMRSEFPNWDHSNTGGQRQEVRGKPFIVQVLGVKSERLVPEGLVNLHMALPDFIHPEF